jgi:hypothetical protein
MGPRLEILISSGAKKGTQIYFSFLSKIPANEPAPGYPTGPLLRERHVRKAFFTYLSNF